MGGCATKQFPSDGPITPGARRAIKPKAFEHDTSPPTTEAADAPTTQVDDTNEGKNEEERPLVVETKVVAGETSKDEESVTQLMAKPKEEKNDGVIEDAGKNVPDNIDIDQKEKLEEVPKTEAVPKAEAAPKAEEAPKTEEVAKEEEAPKEKAAPKIEAASADKSETTPSSTKTPA